MTSAAAFVEGGIQDSCDDACSICLEAFTEGDPSTGTSCKHEFHFQCILEWCQRSSQCPMCWQPLSLKDPTCQELLEAVEVERNLRLAPRRNVPVFHHPALGDFEFQHVGGDESELEERIIRQLAAAAAGRAHHLPRREGRRIRASSRGRQRILVFSAQSGETEPPAIGSVSPRAREPGLIPVQPPQSTPPSGSRPHEPEGAASATPSSDLQSLMDSVKSRFNAAITRHREMISKSTRGWKDRLFSRGNSGGEGRGDANGGISRAVERLEIREASDDGGIRRPDYGSS